MTVGLKEYNQKRNFEKTMEPEGKPEYSEDSLRFVVQHHLASRDHFDFRLEWKGVLLSWAVPKGPSYNTRDKRLAVRVEDHPLEYRNFEGTIPKEEYGGGVVMIWDEGYWEPYVNVEDGLSEGMLKFVLKGKRLKGKWALVRMKGKAGEASDNWLLLKEKDEYAKDEEGISEFTSSIRTGRTMAEIEEGQGEKFVKNPFSRVYVQLARLVRTIPEGDEWLYEMKYDGYRILAFIEGNGVRLMTRNGNDITNRFNTIGSSLIDLAKGRAMVLDGEIVIADESGRTDFQALHSYLQNRQSQNLFYIIFDLLALDGEDIRGQTLIERKEKLRSLMQDAPGNLYYSRHVKGHGKASFDAACRAGMEGIIGKKADSVYSGKRNGDWIKIKCDKRQEFVIGGYSLSDKRISGVSSLLLGFYDGEDLVYAGRAGTGISESEMEILEREFEGLKRSDPPFRKVPKLKSNEKVIWLEPKMAAEIKFAEWTRDNLLRHASYLGLRKDKDPKEIKKERPEDEYKMEFNRGNQIIMENKREAISGAKGLIIEGVKISSPDKIIYDELGITKEEVIRYYSMVADRMLPYVKNRILSIVRCPKGVTGACFYKKHPGPGSEGIVTIDVPTGQDEMEEYFYIENKTGLISEAQMGTLEFHVWGSSVNNLEKPDMMVFDLDPDEGMDIGKIRQGVMDLKSLLDELGLKSYLKISGGKGYHVVIPLKPSAEWDKFHGFARQVAQVMENKWPDRYTSNVRKASRKGRIFIDWIRNARGSTSIAPYSLRARKGAKVSMPISWDELYTVTPDGIDMKGALIRIEGKDPWEDFFRNNQSIK